jgi:putative transcriptional regulator
MTTSKDILEATGAGNGPAQILITMGYAGWGAGQLEEEIAANAWLTVKAEPHILFALPPEARFDAAIGLLGINRAQLSALAGHA